MAAPALQPVPRGLADGDNYIEQRQWLENLRSLVNAIPNADATPPTVDDVDIPTATPDVLGAKMNELLAALRSSGILSS